MTLNVHMTNRKINLGDRVLTFLKKKRRAVFPKGIINSIYKESDPFVSINVALEYESFWSALLSRRK